MDTTRAINTISFFTGYGGIERGLELAGERINHLASCEIEAYSEANLIHKMETGALAPHPIWTDAKTFPGEQFLGKVDLFTGGFPCQPFSAAGSRNADDDPRHLFPACLRAIESFRPTRVFLENVEGLISAKLGGEGWADPKGTPVLLHVLRELERRGYSATWGVFSASEAGAPHQRKRVFILAHSSNLLGNGRIHKPNEFNESKPKSEPGNGSGTGTLWPKGRGSEQFEWEPPRTITKPELGGTPSRVDHRVDRLRMLGNGVVPHTARIAWIELNKRLQND